MSTASTAPDDLLALVRDFTLRVGSQGVEISGPSGRASLRLEGLLDLLAAFEEPKRTGDVLARLPATGAFDWVERAASLSELRRVGVLAAPGATDPKRRGFASAGLQAEMLHDAPRVSAYLRAIAAVVRPGDIVVDLGTGSGLLAVAAAKAGARHVYALEESSIADVAARVFQESGASDRVTLIRGHSTRVTLPERADVLVTETLGNDPLDEGMLLFVEDAKQRLLKSDARIIPERLDLVLVAVAVPDGAVPVLTEAVVDGWLREYGVNLAPLLSGGLDRSWRLRERFAEASSSCSAPVVVERLDLRGETAPLAELEAKLVVDRDVEQTGVALGYDVLLASATAASPAVTLEVGPHAPHAKPSHWTVPVFAPLAPKRTARGEIVTARLVRDRTACRVLLT